MNKTLISRRRFLGASMAAAAASMLPGSLLAGERSDVIVIGAGLSGLYAASLLEAAGLSVRVLEGRDRIGGRIHTLDHVHGKPEAGGQTIGSTYGRTIFAAMKYGLELEQVDYRPGPEPVQQLLHVGGQRILPAQWAQSPANPFTGPHREMLPDRLLFELLGEVPFRSANDWHKEAFAHLDRPLAALFREKGLDDRAIRLLDANLDYGESIERTSLLFMLRAKSILLKGMATPGGQKHVVGGNQRLPEAMARALKGEVLQGRVVKSIAQGDGGMEVRCDDGASYRARFVVAAIPLPALRTIEIAPGLPPLQAEAVQKITYGKALQFHLRITSPFWRGKGFMPNVFSDSPIERIFAHDPQQSGELTNITIWINGDGVDRYEAMSRAAMETAVMSEFGRILPEAKGAVELEDIYSWQSSPLSGGTYAGWGAGQVSRYARVVARPHGNLFFAGEHTGVWSSGIEGALESGERAANEIIARL